MYYVANYYLHQVLHQPFICKQLNLVEFKVISKYMYSLKNVGSKKEQC